MAQAPHNAENPDDLDDGVDPDLNGRWRLSDQPPKQQLSHSEAFLSFLFGHKPMHRVSGKSLDTTGIKAAWLQLSEYPDLPHLVSVA